MSLYVILAKETKNSVEGSIEKIRVEGDATSLELGRIALV